MSGLGLDAALTGLRAAQQQLNVISNNVANVSTAGYNRETLPQQTQVLLGQSSGVLTSPVVRSVDLDLEKELWTQISSTQQLTVQSGYMSQIQQFNGDPTAEISISAYISQLKDAFTSYANAPEDASQASGVLTAAQQVASKFNSYSTLLNQMRNDTQTQMQAVVTDANANLQSIATLNAQIKSAIAGGRSVAAFQDQRDQAVQNLSQDIGISTFTRADGVLVVQTTKGEQLADTVATPLTFNPNTLSASSSYPASAAGLYIGDPATSQVAVDITTDNVGGKLGGYLDMRDNKIPQYQAQIDELAQKLSSRLSAQGVTLFTDKNGQVPADGSNYTGYAGTIQVNSAIVKDPTLVQNSTLTNVTTQSGSAEFLNRVIDYAFGDDAYMQAQGSTDIRSGPTDTLQSQFGLNPQAQIVSSVDTAVISTSTGLNTAVGNPFSVGGTSLATFTLEFDTGGARDTGPINIDLNAVATANPSPPATSGAQALVDYINNTVVPGLTSPLNSTSVISASLNQFGQMVINSQYATTIGAGNMGTTGLSFLGLTAGTTAATQPYFTVQVGGDDPVKVSIAPGDTSTTLLAKLNAVPGLQASIDPSTGYLSLRPGPNFGGDLKIVDGSILSASGNSVVKQLFGTTTPVSGVANSSFASTGGPNGTTKTNLETIGTITDYADKLIAGQTNDINAATTSQTDQENFQTALQKQLQNDSGVNLDEELSNLIVAQTAYSASAKTISTINQMFDTLLQAFE